MVLEGTGQGVTVAVIDSGVHPGHDHIDPAHLLPGFSIAADGTIDDSPDAALDRLGHGTAVTAAIQEKAPDARILPIRVFRESLKTSAYALITAIDEAAAMGADLINLSLGSTNPAHIPAFTDAVERAAAAGAVIIAPREVGETPCYPGALPGVIAVGLDWDCPRETWRVDTDGTLTASGYPRPIPGVAQRRNIHGISFATAQITGFSARAFGSELRGTGKAGRTEALYRALSLHERA